MIIEEQKQKRKEYQKRWREKNKERIKEHHKEYYQRPEVKKRIKEYESRPEVKKRRKEYNQRPEVKEIQKKWRDNPKVKKRRKEHLKKYYKIPKVKEQIKLRRKSYTKQNKKHIGKYTKKWHNINYKEDKEFNIKKRLRSNFYQALKIYSKIGKIMTSKKYGIDYKAIVEHLKPFPKDISKYHIDHIKPLCSFNFINEDGTTNLEEVKKAFTPKNHQWLLIEENLAKISEDLKVSLKNNKNNY